MSKEQAPATVGLSAGQLEEWKLLGGLQGPHSELHARCMSLLAALLTIQPNDAPPGSGKSASAQGGK